jgi:hypothetical protein
MIRFHIIRIISFALHAVAPPLVEQQQRPAQVSLHQNRQRSLTIEVCFENLTFSVVK